MIKIEYQNIPESCIYFSTKDDTTMIEILQSIKEKAPKIITQTESEADNLRIYVEPAQDKKLAFCVLAKDKLVEVAISFDTTKEAIVLYDLLKEQITSVAVFAGFSY